MLRFDGLANLGEASLEARRRVAETLGLGLRTDDVVEWTAEEALTIVGMGLPPGSRRVETRLADIVRPLLARLSRSLDAGIELRVGSSTYPQDGHEAYALLSAAIERAR